MLQFSEFVWALSFSVWDAFNNFLLIDATDRSKIISDQKRFFIALSLYPLSFFANTPFTLSQEKKGEAVNIFLLSDIVSIFFHWCGFLFILATTVWFKPVKFCLAWIQYKFSCVLGYQIDQKPHLQ